jgi:primosomal protein N' (replication factor Y)
MTPPIARVALDVPLDEVFDYLAPGATPEDIGRRVRVPFGRRQVVGVLVGLSDRSDLPPAKLKAVGHLFRDIPPLSAADLKLLGFCADYYHHPLGEVVLNSLPTRLRQTGEQNLPSRRRYHLTETGQALSPEQLPPRAGVQKKLLALLQDKGAAYREEIADLAASAPLALKQFIAQGWVEERTELPTLANPAADPPLLPDLSPPQRTAVESVLNAGPGYRVWLLHGITGSGKTEVYLRLIAHALAQGQQALALVPEINLTPQLEDRIRRRFPGKSLVSLHSGLNDTERLHHWLLAQSGQADIVLGTRLAVFTPLPRLGLIVADEEHDGSYKQQDGLRYSARDVAVVRASQSGVPIVLGSATPSLESWHNAQTGRYTLLDLPERAAENAALPAVHLVDSRRYKPEQGFSEPLLRAIGSRLERKEQSLLFINRRGFAPVLLCSACGWAAPCYRCATRLVVHLRERVLRCHHCGHEERIPLACPSCGNADLVSVGHGTQRVEETLAARFPEARILRVDRDSTRRKHALKDMLAQVHAGEADILVGTQMLAKGHDFPQLTLVGILDADGALYSSDFRASERLFAQLMQVAGRAGRAAAAGEVLIQTGFPDHPLYAALQRHDYASFADSLLEERRMARFPPFCHQALLRAEAPSLSNALDFLQQAMNLGKRLDYPVDIYDPVPAQMARLAGKERAHLLVQADARKPLQTFLARWMAALRREKQQKVRWSLDVDPLEF